MPYIVKKIIHGKWNYWLDKSSNWNGLINNANLFNDKEYAERLCIKLASKDPQSEVSVCIATNHTLTP